MTVLLMEGARLVAQVQQDDDVASAIDGWLERVDEASSQAALNDLEAARQLVRELCVAIETHQQRLRVQLAATGAARRAGRAYDHLRPNSRGQRASTEG
jgi:hypothetical protein